MSTAKAGLDQTLDGGTGSGQLLRDVLDGFRKPQKITHPKYFYDEMGSRLFERICGLEEYYIPRTEIAIMQKYIGEICAAIGSGAALVEYGCGNCAKTALLLENAVGLTSYLPIDISYSQLQEVAQSMMARYPGLPILPVCADYTRDIKLPCPPEGRERIVAYFPGSSFGNFHAREGSRFLRQVARLCGVGGGLLIGLDLKKDPDVLHSAYNDNGGVTADFNLNVLRRINRELSADFDLEGFKHYAFYNPRKSHVEMHLVSLADQSVTVAEEPIHFSRGESIWTESSYKFDLREFALFAEQSGFRVEHVWTDGDGWFSIQFLRRVRQARRRSI